MSRRQSLAALRGMEDVLMSHMYRHPIGENIIRMNDSVSFENMTRLPDRVSGLIVYKCDFADGLAVDKIFNKRESKDVMKEYDHPNVLAAMQLIDKEIDRREQQVVIKTLMDKTMKESCLRVCRPTG
jgi:hypothetical protein